MMLNPKHLQPGQEQHEIFHGPRLAGVPGKPYCQYDYRDKDGQLFSCVATTLEAAKTKRDKWLKERMES